MHLPRWPKALDGFRLAQLTDLHFRPGKDEKLIGKITDALGDEDVDPRAGIDEPERVGELRHRIAEPLPDRGCAATEDRCGG